MEVRWNLLFFGSFWPPPATAAHERFGRASGGGAEPGAVGAETAAGRAGKAESSAALKSDGCRPFLGL